MEDPAVGCRPLGNKYSSRHTLQLSAKFHTPTQVFLERDMYVGGFYYFSFRVSKSFFHSTEPFRT
jgi:hypothetical protein